MSTSKSIQDEDEDAVRIESVNGPSPLRRMSSLRATEPSKQVLLCYVTYSRDAEDKDELDIIVGEKLIIDTSHVVNQDDENGWLYAIKEDGAEGLVPSNFVKIVVPGPEEAEENEMDEKSRGHHKRRVSHLLARVDFNRISEAQDELSLRVGDMLTMDMAHPVNRDAENGWFLAVDKSGKEGLVPSNFIQIIDIEKHGINGEGGGGGGGGGGGKTRRPSSGILYTAVVSRKAEADDELDVKVGDVVLVDMSHEVNREDNGWFLAADIRTDRRGLLPSSCLRLNSSPSSVAAVRQRRTGADAQGAKSGTTCVRVFDPEATQRVPSVIYDWSLDDIHDYDALSEQGWVITSVVGRSALTIVPGDTVEIDYVGYVWDGTSQKIDMFENTRVRRAPKWIQVGGSKCPMQGLSEALRSLRVGQIADVVIAPGKAFGERGNLRLCVGPNSYIVLKDLRLWRKVTLPPKASCPAPPAPAAAAEETMSPLARTKAKSFHSMSTEDIRTKMLPTAEYREQPILQRLQELIAESDRAAALSTTSNATGGGGGDRCGRDDELSSSGQDDGVHKVTYVKVRDSLVNEFGRASFNLNKRLIQKTLLAKMAERHSSSSSELQAKYKRMQHRSDSLRSASVPSTVPMKMGEILKTFSRLGTWVTRKMILTEGYIEYNSGWYHRHSMSAKRRRIYFGDVQYVAQSQEDPDAFSIVCRAREKPYVFKGKGWYTAIVFALRDFRRTFMPSTNSRSSSGGRAASLSSAKDAKTDEEEAGETSVAGTATDATGLESSVLKAARNSSKRRLLAMEIGGGESES
eukprot:g641.t1